jgi:hypothetical protein
MEYIVKNNRIFLTESDLHRSDYLKLLFQLPSDGLSFAGLLTAMGTTTATELKNKADAIRKTIFIWNIGLPLFQR